MTRGDQKIFFLSACDQDNLEAALDLRRVRKKLYRADVSQDLGVGTQGRLFGDLLFWGYIVWGYTLAVNPFCSLHWLWLFINKSHI